MYDYIIIGGGIAGLYMNYLLSKDYKTLLLEKNNYFGGRAIDVNFHNSTIKLGAGISGLDNKHLLRLLKELKIKTIKFKSDINIISNNNHDMKKKMKEMINDIKKLYKKLPEKDTKYLSSKKFIIKYFGKEYFDLYSTFTEYTDFFESSIESYIKYYPIDDHIPSKYTIIYVDWMLLINKLINHIKKYNKLIKNYTVDKIIYNKNDNYYVINNKYKTKKIIFCITINNLIKLINNLPIKINYNNYIGAIPFLRLYTYHKDGHKLDIPRYNIIDNKLQKIIIISDKILMISYSDNNNALYWKKYLNNKNKLIQRIKYEILKLFNKNIIIDDIKIAYWEEGIHYFKPDTGLKAKEIIDKISNPIDNIFVCGEMLSLRQGWVEGAIKSVDKLYHKIK